LREGNFLEPEISSNVLTPFPGFVFGQPCFEGNKNILATLKKRMKSKLINDAPQKTWALVFDKGDEVIQGLKQFARENNLSASQFTAIGAFSDLTLGFFIPAKKDYKHIPLHEQVEVLSLIGDISLGDQGPMVHAHVVVGKIDGSAHGGHLVSARVMPTLEVILTESPVHLRRAHDPEVGLALINLQT